MTAFNPFRLLLFSLTVVLLFSLLGCSDSQRSLDEILQSGTINIATRNSEYTYYENRDGEASGFEYQLTQAFARSLNLRVNYLVYDNIEDVLESVAKGKADMAAASLTVTENRAEEFLFGPSYMTIKTQVVCSEGVRPKELEDLTELRVAVEHGTSYEEDLERLKAQKLPSLAWTSSSEDSTAQILQKISDKLIDCTLADSHLVQIYRRYFPDLTVPLDLEGEQELAWLFGQDASALQQASKEWLNSGKGKNSLRILRYRHFDYAQGFDSYDIKKFYKRTKTRLPKLKQYFKEASELTGWSWPLLAAIAYQESHWSAKSRSPTGVRGIMMLTLNTAKSVGVSNRLDPKQSILGGAKYLKKMERRVPSYIPFPDRRWMALAAYNVGFSHLRDARGVAAWKNRNPNSWVGVREVLPLLSKKSIYKRLPHGYARGLEPTVYVKRVRNYHDLLLNALK